MIEKIFIKLVSGYTPDEQLIKQLWNEIENQYSDPKRHYHNLSHLDAMLVQIMAVKYKIDNFDTLLFSMYYHDIVYNPLKSNNEKKSADLAAKRLKQIGVRVEMIKNCKEQILATKSHQASPSMDTNYLTDADLAVLGLPWDLYSDYSAKIKKEYSVYPEWLYIIGRKRVLNYFMGMDRIFKTAYFYEKFEKQARVNVSQELELITRD